MFFGNKQKSLNSINSTDLPLPEPFRSYAAQIGLRENNLQKIREIQSTLNAEISPITEIHYQYILSNSELVTILESNSTLERLKTTFREYLISCFSGVIDDRYLQKREAIGNIHQKIGLGPEWYQGSIANIYSHIQDVLFVNIKNKAALKLSLESLHKILSFDSQIILKRYSENYIYQMNDNLCESVDQSADSKNIETVLHTKEKILEVVSVLEGLQKDFLDSEKESIPVQNSFNDLISGSNETIFQMKSTKVSISESIQSIEDISTQYRSVLTNWENLHRGITSIKGIILIIEDIAERTNLLSLNASIEAARAGKEGAGFAVVSSEINKLSVQTAESVQSITSVVKSLVKEIEVIDRETQKLGYLLDERVKNAMYALEALETMLQSANKAGENLSHFKENFDSLYKKFQISSQKIIEVLEIQMVLAENTEENAKLLFYFTGKVNDLRKKNLTKIRNIPTQAMIRTVKTEHLLWKWWLVSFLFGIFELPEEQVVDHTQCRLGKWYYNLKNSNISKLPSFRSLEQPHIELHKLAKSIYNHIKNKEVSEARKELLLLEQLSKEIIGYLNLLEKEIETTII